MFKTDSRRGIAAAAAAVLAFAGLTVSAPAQAAVGLNVEPEKGSTYVVPVTDRMDIKVYTDGIPTDLINNLKFKVESTGGREVKYQTATGSGVATTTTVLGAASTSAVISSVTKSPGVPTVLSLDLFHANLSYTSASATIKVTAWLDADSDGLVDDTYAAAPVDVTFLDGDNITWTNEFATPALGVSAIDGFVSTTDVNMQEINKTVHFYFTEGSTVSNAVTASFNATAGKFKATATSASWTAGTTAGTLQAANSGIVSALTYKAKAQYDSIDVGTEISRKVGATGVAQVNGVSTSATATNTTRTGDRVTVSPTATSVKITAEAWSGSAGVEAQTVTFTVAETGLASMDVGAVLKVGTTEVKFANAGVQTTDGKFTAVTDVKGIATIEVAISGAKTGNAFTVVASVPGVNATTAVTYTFQTAAAGSVAVLNMIDVNGGVTPVLAGVAKDTSFALDFAVLDTYGALLTNAGHSVRLSTGSQTVSAAVVGGKVTVTWPGFSSTGDKTIDVAVLKDGAVVSGVSQDLSVKVGTAGVPSAVSQTSTDLGTATTATLSLMTKAWTNADTRLGQKATSSLDGAKSLTGVVTDANGNAVAGADVKLSGAGLNFNAHNVLYTTGEITVKTNSDGQYTVNVYSATAGKKTVAITAASASRNVDLYYVTAGGTAGTGLTITTTATGDVAAPGTTVRITVKLVDAAGNPVAANDTGSEDFSITVTGPGFVSAIPTQTNSSGEAIVSVLLGSTDTGNLVVTASYDRDGKTGTEYAAIAATKTVTVQAPDAPAVDVVIGSFNGRWAVRTENAKGSAVSIKVGGKWYKATATSDSFVFSRKSKVGATVLVKVWVAGDLQNEQTITVK
jgi:hypothetical protein